MLLENAMLRNNQLTNCLLDYGIGKPKGLKSLCCGALWVRIPHLAYETYDTVGTFERSKRYDMRYREVLYKGDNG